MGSKVMDEWFSEAEPNVIVSSTGEFTVEVLGMTGMRYTEGHRSVRIDSEVLATDAIVMVNESIKTWEGEGARPVSAADRDRIVSNIERAFAFRGYELQVQGPFDWTSVAMRPPNERHK